MNCTIEKVLLFRANADGYIKNNPKSKFTYALEKMISRTQDVAKKFEEYMADQRVERASVDDKGNIIQTDKGQMSYTKDQMKALNADGKKKSQDIIEVEPYFASEVPEDLSIIFRDYFTGFVIKEESDARTN